MNQLLEIRKNTYYTKENSESTDYNRVHEFVFVVDEPKYSRTNEGAIIRERGCKELRFTLNSDTALDNVIEVLKKYRDSKEEDLK